MYVHNLTLDKYHIITLLETTTKIQIIMVTYKSIVSVLRNSPCYLPCLSSNLTFKLPLVNTCQSNLLFKGDTEVVTLVFTHEETMKTFESVSTVILSILKTSPQ